MRMQNRFYQVLSMVVLLIAAVALTTALVVAAERSSDGSKRSMWHKSDMQTPFVEASGPKEWV